MRRLNWLGALSAMVGGVLVAACATSPVASTVEKTAAEELFGSKIAGVHDESQLTWDECIEPDGDTLYHIDGAEMQGQLRISDAGLACFVYPEYEGGVEECYSVERTSDGYSIMRPGEESSRFSATSVESGVESCPGAN